nr:RNA-dependent RNA polymerase [Ailanthus crinkle leaf associated emaravirus]
MDTQRVEALKFSSELIEKVKDPNSEDNSFNELVNEFMGLVHRSRSKITGLISRKEVIQRIYHRQIQSSNESLDKFIDLGKKLCIMRPNKYLLDVVTSVITILEMTRHDIFLDVIKNTIEMGSDYKYVDTDFKLSDYFPEVSKRLTPDLLFKNDSGDYLIIEAKVTVQSDLKYFFERYKMYVKEKSLVSVVNLNLNGILHYGESKFDFNLIMDHPGVNIIYQIIEICSDIRQIYNKFPEFSYFTNFYSSIVNEDHFIMNYKDRYNNLESIAEIKNIFGEYYDDLINAVETFDMVTNESSVVEELKNAEGRAIQYCKENLGEFMNLFENNKAQGLYKQTVLTIGDLGEFQDTKASLTYDFKTKLGVSLYLPLTYGRKINMPRKENYQTHFSQSFKLSDNSQYTSAVAKLLSIISEEDCISNLLEKHDKKIVDVTTSKYADAKIFQNNAFSITNDYSKSIRTSICSTPPKKDNDGRKRCLNYQEEVKRIPKLKMLLYELFNNRYNNKSYDDDLSEIVDNCKLANTLSSDHTNNFLDYLFIQHSFFKSLISVNVISNKKFRLIQTQDPNTIMIALPNSDSFSGAPLRYFTVSIEENDKASNSIELNKLLGIYNSHLCGPKSTILISKVISLDMTRVKLLSTSFAKYCQLISYYRSISTANFNINFDIHIISLLFSNLVTMSSLSLTDTFKNIMMVCYSTFSNPEELIHDKLDCKPTTLAHILLLSRMFDAISKSQNQRDEILKSIKTSKISDDLREITDTGFDISSDLYMPISGLRVNNPKEILHEAYILFYLGNKGLHGSPQELLKLYHVPYEFEKEYQEMLDEYGTFFQEKTHNPSKGCSYEAMKISIKLTYSKLMPISRDLRSSIIDDLGLKQSILTKPQFTSTKSMVRDNDYNQKNINDPNEINNLSDLENYIKSKKIDDPYKFVIETNKVIMSINKIKMNKSLVTVDFYGEEKLVRSNYNKLPTIAVKTINNSQFIVFENFKKKFIHPCGVDCIRQYSDKVFNNVIETCDKYKLDTLGSFYESDYLENNKPLIRIFYKDQRSFVDREIYTGNLTTRLCLYPVESLFKTINKRLPEEAISIQGEKKQKKMLDQRIELLKKRKQYNKNNIYKSEILSMSCDASKWSARDMSLKFLLTIAFNPFVTSEEKYFYLYLFCKYYKKYIVLTDDALFNAIRFYNPNSGLKSYEEITDGFTKNYQLIRSNWLQGNLNSTSSFVHYCSAKLSEVMLEVLNQHYLTNNHMNFMVHSDDSVYDFLIMKQNNRLIDSKHTGTFLYTLIQWSTMKHSITINRKKTYISNFYKEFLSSLLVGDELFYFYLADLLPISCDVTYDSPMDDLASYSGYINNAFTHSCPVELVRTSLSLMNHLTMSTYNLHITSPKSPYKNFLSNNKLFNDLPIQLFPRYKLPIQLAGLLPYYSGDAFRIFERILKRLGAHIDLEGTLMFEDIFNKDLIDKYFEYEVDQGQLNYIKACILTCNDDIMTKVPEDPYNLTDIDSSRKNLIAVLPTIKETKIKRTYTHDIYKSRENDYRIINSINPFWCLSNPVEHEEIRSKIICNYTNKKFCDSLTFSRPQLAYAKRIISSNSKVYKYNLDDDPNLMVITDLYERVVNDVKNVKLDSQVLLNYLNLHLFTDKKVSSAVYLYYTKKEMQTYSKDKVSYKICIPRSIYPSDYGQYSINTIIRDLLILNQPQDVRDIDPKCKVFIDLCQEFFSKNKIDKYYEYPEDIDTPFKNYCDLKYKTKDYINCLIQPQNIDKDYDFIIMKNKIHFQGLIVKYLDDINKRLVDPSHKISYVTPRSLLLTIDSFMKRDITSTKLHIMPRKSEGYEQYVLDKFSMYANDDLIIRYKVNHKIRVSNDKLLHNSKLQSRAYDELNFIKFIRSKTSCFNEIRYKKIMNGRSFNDILESFTFKNYDTNTALFLHHTAMISDADLMNRLMDTPYTMNYWSVPSESNLPYSQALYFRKGVIMKVTCNDVSLRSNVLNTMIKEQYNFNVEIYKPRRMYRIKPDTMNELLFKFRTDFKGKLTHAIFLRHNQANDYSIYMDGYHLTTSYSPASQVLVNYRTVNYDEIKTIISEDANGNNTYVFNVSNKYINQNFVIRDWTKYNWDTIYELLTSFRGYDFYNTIISESKILDRNKELFGFEYKYLNSGVITEHINKYLDISGEGEAFSDNVMNDCYKLYSLSNTMMKSENVSKIDECLFPLLKTFEIDVLNNDFTYYDKELDQNTTITKIISLQPKPILSSIINKQYRILEREPFPELINLITYKGVGSTKSKILSIIYYICRFYLNEKDDNFSGFD